jgi:hypothetical protein
MKRFVLSIKEVYLYSLVKQHYSITNLFIISKVKEKLKQVHWLKVQLVLLSDLLVNEMQSNLYEIR